MDEIVKQPVEVVEVAGDESVFTNLKKTLLVKSDRVKVIRMELPATSTLPKHKAPGELTVHCLSGKIEFTVMGNTHQLDGGNLIYVPASEPHSVLAVEDSVMLLTIFN